MTEIVERKLCEDCAKHCPPPIPPADAEARKKKSDEARKKYRDAYGSDPGEQYGNAIADGNQRAYGGLQAFPYCCGASVMTALYDAKKIETQRYHHFTVATTTPEQKMDEAMKKAGFKVLATFRRAHGGQEPTTMWGIGMNEEKPQAKEVIKAAVAEVKKVVKTKKPAVKKALKKKSRFSIFK